jgi:hypothetical protein
MEGAKQKLIAEFIEFLFRTFDLHCFIEINNCFIEVNYSLWTQKLVLPVSGNSGPHSDSNPSESYRGTSINLLNMCTKSKGTQ